jgi:hypothetical protein
VYGPCNDRLLFWDRLLSSSLLDAKKLILEGDLNFTTGANEVWGPTSHLDRHAGYFLNMIKDHSLVDLAPDILIPT